MKLQVLMENTCRTDSLSTEHGLSLYLETGGCKILFDTGQTEAFAENAAVMGVNLSEVDLAVLSHGHYDHGGGIARFLKENNSALVYLSCHAFDDYYSGMTKYIGLNPELQNSNRLVKTFCSESDSDTDMIELVPGIELYSCNKREKKYGFQSYGLYRVTDGEKVLDDFRHEQYLLIHEGDKKILISGCSHKGILNLVDWFRPDVLIGGFHFVKLDPQREGRKELEKAAEILKSYPTVYYTGHCTGAEQYRFLKERMGEQLRDMATGDMILI